ncbi:MAG: radical SAM protein, partial [Coriobacteriales bacterium]|nr:radical SAM protein [Coriobacteriales bacterium]
MLQNPDILPPRVALYDTIEAEYIAGLKEQGVRFADTCTDEAAKARAIARLQERGAQLRNGGASISVNSLSSACVACTGDRGSKTFLLSLLCDRQCYFCFNPNQHDYAEQRRGLKDWQAELDAYGALNAPVSHIALTGGEPLVHAEETVRFFETVRARYPDAYTRLYTTGDRLDTNLLEALSKTQLTEIRFSIKIDDPSEALAQTLRHIALARSYIPQVMVEMPVIPGTGQEMRELLDTLDELGIFGINLLEFCYPRHNWPEFESRGFRVKNPPFPVLYEYGYAGGLPIAGSEELSLELLSYALD